MRQVCLRNPFPVFLVVIPSIQSLPEAWGSSWELQHALPALHYGCSMPIPSLYCNCRKSPSSAEKRGCQPFSYLCSQNVTQCRKEMNVTSLSTQSMFLWKSKPPLGLSRKFRIFLNLASSSLLVCKASLLWNLSTVCSTNSALCLHHAHPFVAASEKSTCLMQRSKAFGHAIVVSKMFWSISDCALSCAMGLLQTNEHLSRLSF